MTNVSSAAIRPTTDTGVAGGVGKSSSQATDGGQFAQVLDDADSEAGSQETPLQAVVETDETGQSIATISTLRFKALDDLTAKTASTGTPQTDPVSAADAALDPAALATQDPTATLQLATRPVAIVPGDKVEIADGGASADSDATAQAADLAELIGLAVGAKKTTVGQAQGDAGKAKSATDAAEDVAAGTDSDAILADTSADANAVLSTNALLQIITPQTPSATRADTARPQQQASVVDISGYGMRQQTDNAVDSALSATAVIPSAADDGVAAMPVTADDDVTAAIGDGDARTIRIQKAGDTAAALGLSLTRDADGKADLQEAVAGTSSQDTVVVLDSRRYLGFGMGSNASALLSSATGNREWSAAMQPSSALSNAAAVSSTGNVVNTLKLQLTPDHLGSVTANMRLVNDQLSIHLVVHNAAAYRELDNDSKPMLDALRAQGFNVDQVTVSIAPAADTSASSDQQQQQSNGSSLQGQQQQTARDGEAARQQSQGQSRNGAQGNGNGTEKRNETAVETSTSGSSGTGSIYL